MPAKADVSGIRFGRLVATSNDKTVRENTGRSLRLIECLCDCGNTHFAQVKHLRSGESKSCGCLYQEKLALGNVKHGHCPANSTTKEYRAWLNIKQRCTNPNSSHFDLYGGRGISMCQQWADSFECFLSHVGLSPSPKHSIDRIESNGNYEPGNVKWSTDKEQAMNRSIYIKEEIRSAIREHRKLGLSYKAIAAITGVSPASVRNIILGIY